MPEPTADPLEEARRTLALCRICGYCNGLCETFRAAQRRQAFTDGDLAHLAHLCHNCRACWHACQYAPPHRFAINVPAVLARVRTESYRRRAWPLPAGRAGRWRGPGVAKLGVAGGFLTAGAAALSVGHERLFRAHTSPEAFYAVIPWPLMSSLAAVALAYAVITLLAKVRGSFRDPAGPSPRRTPTWRAWAQAAGEALALRNLDGGGAGCHDPGKGPWQWRRLGHHAVLHGFLLCLAATLAGAAYHHGLGRPAPYTWTALPSLLGSVGGAAILAGSGILLAFHRTADPRPAAREAVTEGKVLIYLLSAVAASGLALQFLRGTPAMGLLLTVHLGTVLGLFLTAPHSKAAHGPYRLAALARAAEERRERGE